MTHMTNNEIIFNPFEFINQYQECENIEFWSFILSLANQKLSIFLLLIGWALDKWSDFEFMLVGLYFIVVNFWNFVAFFATSNFNRWHIFATLANFFQKLIFWKNYPKPSG